MTGPNKPKAKRISIRSATAEDYPAMSNWQVGTLHRLSPLPAKRPQKPSAESPPEAEPLTPTPSPSKPGESPT